MWVGTILVVLGVTAALPGEAQAQRITFEDIYAAPDDPELGLAFARQQIEAGQLSDAASALERMLFANRDWDSARLLYALTLLRLDDRAGAAREAQLLAGRPLSARNTALLARINDRLAGASARVSTGDDWSGRIALSGRYDDNAGGVFGDIVFGGNDRPDESAQLQGVVQFTTPVGSAGTSAFMRADTTLRVHDTESGSDLGVLGFAGGLRGASGRVNWTLGARADFIDIGKRSYLDQAGITGRLGFDVADTFTLGVGGSWLDEDYAELPGSPNASDRSGGRLSVGPFIDWQPFQSLRVTASAQYQDKTARDDSLAYDGYRLSLGGRLAVTDDVYLTALGAYRQLDYKADNVFVFPAGPRKDEYWRARAAIGVNAAGLTGREALRPFSIEAVFNHSARETNIPGRGFDNSGGELRLIFDF